LEISFGEPAEDVTSTVRVNGITGPIWYIIKETRHYGSLPSYAFDPVVKVIASGVAVAKTLNFAFTPIDAANIFF